VSCHLKDYQGTTNPNHVTANFPQTCDQCHDTSSWLNSTFNHASTGFTLTGLHTVPPRACTDCHVNNNYALNTTACVSCHLKDYQGTTAPNHASANFPQTCDTCHDTTNWMDATFNHNNTGFPLTGSHTVPPRACTDCHVSNNYNLNSTACVTCHLKDYQGTTSPNHVTANFPQTCNTCHDTNLWTNSTWNHSSTGFPLTNSHLVPPRTCTDCHVNSNYSLTSTLCYSCHQKDYAGTTSPPHATVGFPTTCDTCHDTNLWTDATFNHNNTSFPLTGTHTTTACATCHVNNNYTTLPTTCVGCHQTDYNNATTPVAHAAANFPTTCANCHDTVLWTDGKFDHSTTGFTLTNSHLVPPRLCTDCHVNNNYSLNSTLCYSCHQANFTGTTNPAHVSAGFPTTCELCHDTIVWTDSTFNHNNTTFPLVGTHTTTPCANCHVNANYTTLPTTCIGCHQTDYNGTTNPPHSASANSTFFPTTCLNCHLSTLIDWTGASFPHTTYTRFSTTHGNAGGVCSTCHITMTNLAIFQCTGCHGNNNAANFQHPNVSGYVYNSSNCYQCHAGG
jgi:NMD protein affecting ribosome stability and mRNA decay